MSSRTAHVTWGLIATVAAADMLVIPSRGLSLSWPTMAVPAVVSLGLLVLAMFYAYWRLDERLAVALTGTAQLVLFSAIAEALSYAVATFAAPLQDSNLAAMDRALGMDWQAYLLFVNAHSWLASIYSAAYNSILAQLVVAIVGLGMTGRLAACRIFVAAVIVSGTLIIAISAFLPATPMFTHLGLAAKDYPALDVAAVFASVGPFEGLRNGTLNVVSLADAEGIIAFPSYHAALAVILLQALWHLRWLRWPGLIVNLTMLASTPLNGGHYFVDVIAGGIVALVVLAAIRALDGAAATRHEVTTRPPAPLAGSISARCEKAAGGLILPDATRVTMLP